MATQSVRISPVAVSSSNITIFLNPTTGVSQPLPFSAGATTILEGENAELIEEVGRFEALMSWTPRSLDRERARVCPEQAWAYHKGDDFDSPINKKRGALQAELIIN